MLYFAVESNFNTNGAVWLFPTDLLGRAVLADHGEIDWEAEKGRPTAKWNASDVRAVYDLKLTVHSQRSAAQQGNFTVCTHVFADHAAAVRASLDGRESADKTQKFVIPSQLKRDFLSRLRMMNVTATSLFPGLDGLGRDARDLAVLRAWRSGSE